MGLFSKFRRAARGGVTPKVATKEIIRRSRLLKHSRNERRTVDQINDAPPRLCIDLEPDKLLEHFASPRTAKFLPGFSDPTTREVQLKAFAQETADLEARANKIVTDHSWPLLGFGDKTFGDEIDWRRDPLSGYVWPLEYHRDLKLIRGDGSDVRVLWELNRMGHFLTTARAYVMTRDEKFSIDFFSQLESWSGQNPFGRGPNWACAMEVALRSINLLAAFEVFRHSPQLNHTRLMLALRLFQQHATYIRNNLEFSYVATSNHYLSDVVGLLWLGVMLPEFSEAEWWKDFGLLEMLREMDKQILPDGADFESSTGYHRFVLELLIYSFVLCKENSLAIHERHWDKLRSMLRFMQSYMRPDGMAPLIGDSDSSQVLPLTHRRADDHGYVLSLGATVFEDPNLKSKHLEASEELLWLLGPKGLGSFSNMKSAILVSSSDFPDAGIFILRNEDLYLCFNASGAGLNGRGSHGHNDALSVEISACGHSFVVDPGSYIYTGDSGKRHQFRSTSYHSTIRVDGREQSSIQVDQPFVIGNEARPKLVRWSSTLDSDFVSAEHYGYTRFAPSAVHRRSIKFNKPNRFWIMHDTLIGEGEHELEVYFHFAPGLFLTVEKQLVIALEPKSGASLIIGCDAEATSISLEQQFVSTDYGSMEQSIASCSNFSVSSTTINWFIVPVCKGESAEGRLAIARS